MWARRLTALMSLHELMKRRRGSPPSASTPRAGLGQGQDPGACGPTCATTGPSTARTRWRPCSSTRPLDVASTRKTISATERRIEAASMISGRGDDGGSARRRPQLRGSEAASKEPQARDQPSQRIRDFPTSVPTPSLRPHSPRVFGFGRAITE